MQWSDFGPYVHPYVTGCPEPVMHHHVRMAAIKFCKKTQCWTRRLELLTSSGVPDVEVEPENQAQIVKIKMLFVDGRKWTLLHPEDGISLAATNSGDEFAFTEEGKTLFVYPVQPTGTPILARAAMAPTTQAKMLHADLDEYAEDIAHGAVASIMRLPLLANADHAMHEAMFLERIKIVSAKVGRGLMAAKLGGNPQCL